MAPGTFGELIKARRIEIGKTLRVFCGEHGFDPGNVSKLERGRTDPPASKEKLSDYAKALELKPDTAEWREFFDRAAAARGEFPADLLSDEELVSKLPVLFRTLRGERVDQDQLDDLIHRIRRA